MVQGKRDKITEQGKRYKVADVSSECNIKHNIARVSSECNIKGSSQMSELTEVVEELKLNLQNGLDDLIQHGLDDLKLEFCANFKPGKRSNAKRFAVTEAGRTTGVYCKNQ